MTRLFTTDNYPLLMNKVAFLNQLLLFLLREKVRFVLLWIKLSRLDIGLVQRACLLYSHFLLLMLVWYCIENVWGWYRLSCQCRRPAQCTDEIYLKQIFVISFELLAFLVLDDIFLSKYYIRNRLYSDQFIISILLKEGHWFII